MPIKDAKLEIMSVQITGKVDQNTITKLNELDPLMYVKYQEKLAKYPQDKQIPKKDFLAIQAAVSKEVALCKEQFAAGINACHIFDAIGVIAQLPELRKVAMVSKLSIEFADKFNILESTIKKIGVQNLLNPTAAMSLFSPITAVMTIAAQIFGNFMHTGPSFEEIMAEQLQAISQQIVHLHKDMLKGFSDIQEHIRTTHKSVLECAEKLHNTLGGQISGLKNYLAYRLDNNDSNLKNLRQIILEVNEDNLLQDLKKLCYKAETIIDNREEEQSNSEIKHVIVSLEAWILELSATKSLTGQMYVIDNNDATYNNDITILDPAPEKLQGSLGYLILIAQHMGLKLAGNATEPQIEPQNIIYVKAFAMAIEKYLEIRKAFPNCKTESTIGGTYTKINSFVQHSIDFISKVQRSASLFKALFADYTKALEEVDQAIQAQINLASEDFRRDYKCDLLDLSSDVNAIRDAFIAMRKMQNKRSRISGQRRIKLDADSSYNTSDVYHLELPDINLDQFSIYDRDDFDLPEEFFIAEILKLGNLSATFWLQDVWLDGRYNQLHTSGNDVNGRSPIHLTKEMCKTAKIGQNYRMIFQFKINKIEHLCAIDMKLTDSTVSITHKPGFPTQTVKHAFKGQWNNILNNQSEAHKHFVVAKVPSNSGLQKLQLEINHSILEYRRKHVAKKLGGGECEQFERALKHLDSSKARLLSFSSLAGLPGSPGESSLLPSTATFYAELSALPSSADVKSSLKKYESNSDIKTPYWEYDISKVNSVEGNCLLAINNPSKPLASTIKNLLQKYVEKIDIHKTLHVYFHTLPKQKPAAANNPELIINLDLLKNKAETTKSETERALINAIISANYTRFNNICKQPNISSTLTEPLNEDFVRPLHLAAYLGLDQFIKRLLEIEKVVDCIDAITVNNGFTALMYAVMSKKIQAVQALCDERADLMATDNAGKTALGLAEDLAKGLADDDNLNDIKNYLNIKNTQKARPT
jgi:hypothetical protein